MTKEQISAINRDRLVAWAGDLAEDHATPVVLVGVGHDHAEGKMSLCFVGDVPEQMVIGLLTKVIETLRAQQTGN